MLSADEPAATQSNEDDQSDVPVRDPNSEYFSSGFFLKKDRDARLCKPSTGPK